MCCIKEENFLGIDKDAQNKYLVDTEQWIQWRSKELIKKGVCKSKDNSVCCYIKLSKIMPV